MPTVAEAFAIAMQHHRDGQLQIAEQIYRQILQVEPQQPDALHLLGLIAYQTGHSDAAIELIGQAIQLRPDAADYQGNLGEILRQRGDLDGAIGAYRGALLLRPDSVPFHNSLGTVLNQQGKLDEAAECHSLAVQYGPNDPESHNNLGTALAQLGRFDEAVASFQRALDLAPSFAIAHHNMSSVLADQGMLQEADRHRRRTLELNPDFAEAHYNRATSWLLQGNYEQGWPEYEWRWRTGIFSRPSFSQPPWDGSPLAGRTILLQAEQGLGDTLQFVRYAPLVAERGGRVLLECPPALVRLLRSCAGIEHVIPEGTALPLFDVYAPLLSLPALVGTSSLEHVPASVPYLEPERESIDRWRARLTTVTGFRVGIVWQGDPKHRRDRWRSAPLERFAAFADVPGVSLISLQKEAGSEQLARWPALALDLGPELTDFAETAAVLRVLDLVICVDTAVAHSAGALGVPTWLALPLVPDWRWVLDRSDSPWYPTMRLFRQTRDGEWSDVFERMTAELRERVGVDVPRSLP